MPTAIPSRAARLGECLVDLDALTIRRGADTTRVTPKAMAVLRQLMEAGGAVVRRDDLIARVWHDQYPGDDGLNHAIQELRRALGDDPRAPRIIETIPRVGHRLCTPVAPAEAGSPADESPGTMPPRSRWPRSVALLLLALSLAAALAVWWPGRRQADDTTQPRTGAARASSLGERRLLVTSPQRERLPTLSPDGGMVAYAQVDPDQPLNRVMVQATIVGATPVEIARDETVSYNEPVWSPDGTEIAFTAISGDNACRLAIAPATGGPIREVGNCPADTLDLFDWWPDGAALVVSRAPDDPGAGKSQGMLMRLDIASGEVRPLDYDRSPSDPDLNPRFSPDGRWIAFRRGAFPHSRLFLVAREGGSVREIASLRATIRGFTWHPDGQRIVMTSDHEGPEALYALDLPSGAMTSLGNVGSRFPRFALRRPLLVVEEDASLTQIVEFELSDGAVQDQFTLIAPATRSDQAPRYSPDGNRIAFVSRRSGTTQLWIFDRDKGRAELAARDVAVDRAMPAWSPDGGSLVYAAHRDGGYVLETLHLATGARRRHDQPGETVRSASYSHDGRWILYTSNQSGAWQAWRVSLDGSAREQLTHDTALDPVDPLGDGAIYYVKPLRPGVYRLDLASREETLAHPGVRYFNRQAWAIRTSGVFEIGVPGRSAGLDITRTPLGGGPATTVARVGFSRPPQLDATSDGSRVVASMLTRDDFDIVAFELP